MPAILQYLLSDFFCTFLCRSYKKYKINNSFIQCDQVGIVDAVLICTLFNVLIFMLRKLSLSDVSRATQKLYSSWRVA